MNGLVTLDWVVIGLYFFILIAVALWVITRRQKDTADYFLAGRDVGWFMVGTSIFASNIGSEHLVGLAGAGADSGVVLGHYEIHAYLILALGWVFAPFYLHSGVYTMPEFLEKRYNATARWFLSVISLVGYVITKVSVTIFAGGVVLETLMGVDFWTGSIILVLLTGLYTVMGGLRAVVYTEALQTIVLVAGAVAVTVIGLVEVGGWNNLREIAGSEHFNMWKAADHPDFPWTGMLFGAPIVGLWYWCTDQYIVQRVLAARNEKQALRGTIFASYLKILPIFIFIVPGIIAFALAKTGRLDLPDTNQALPVMVMTLLPAGVRGLVAGGLLAALMSSLSSVFNSCSTLFTVDIYKKLYPQSSETKLIMVGRIATGVVVVLGILWIPVMELISGQLYEYLQSVQSYIAPPIASVFLLGLFYKRINAPGALTALIGGFGMGMLRLVAEIYRDALQGIPIVYEFATINFLHFCVYSFILCIVAMVIVSMLTPPPPPEKIIGLTYGSITQEQREQNRTSFTAPWIFVQFIHYFGYVLAVFWYFTG
ncbi:MAG: sodium/solute symporter [Bacteroidia bacterium]|nr:sodium/solute symporter [Bacteroidia bacterium]